jgi:Cu(I)/Ag(I) efflux system membrane fusion protein
MKRFFAIMLVAIAAGAAGWYFGKHEQSEGATHDHSVSESKSSGRKILYYQSPMHPWIKSDKPGNCTICGMKLAPVFEGDQPKTSEGNVIQISTNSVTVLHVATTEVTERPLKRTIRAAGIVEDDDTRHRIISAYVAGRIDELHVNFVGADVKQGAPLVTFYSPDLLTAEREFITLLPKNSSAHVIAPESHHPLMEAAALRLKRLGLTDLQITNLATKSPSVQHSEIVAPMSGTIVKRYVYPGQYVMEGEKLFEIADYSKMWLQVNVYERDLPWIRTGQVVRVTATALPGKVFGGRISFIDPTLDETTRSAIVRVELENPLVDVDGQQRRLLYHRLYADAEFEVETAPVLTIDRSAVLNPGGKPMAYVELSDGAYEARMLRLGRRGDDAWEVLEGVAVGDKVVTEGNLMIDSQAQLNHGVVASEHADHGGKP